MDHLFGLSGPTRCVAIRSTPSFGEPIGLGEAVVASFLSGARSQPGLSGTGGAMTSVHPRNRELAERSSNGTRG
jgi:hypothetical protein